MAESTMGPTARQTSRVRPLDAEQSERRLRDLMEANTSIIERLDLEVVLRRIVRAGMTLVGARYGALGVIGSDGQLERFIHVGIDQPSAERIGHLPQGHGVLGAVITDHEPIRLHHLADDPRSVGFPDHHPAMASFLGVPLRVGTEVYGNLYLTESENGSFSADDQGLIVALAATAGIAIENARLYDEARTRELWSATIADVTSAMMGVTGERALDVIAERVAALIDADLVAVVVPEGEHHLVVASVYGSRAEELRGRVYDSAGTLVARVLSSRKAVSVSGEPDGDLFPWRSGIGPTVAIPLYTGTESLGVLSVSRSTDGAGFTPADLEMAFTFAAQASISLEVVRARDDRRRMETSQDRSRIARDLHDHVIQRLFGAGLALQAVTATADARVAETVEAQIDVLDAAIKDIRTIIFALSASDRPGAKRFRDRILDVVAEVTGSWATPPRISFVGPLDSLVSSGLADDALAVLRELLTNVIKHAHAQTAQVSCSLADHHFRMIVEDDGVGMSDPVTRSGLRNVEDRASQRGGHSVITSAAATGTRIEWSVPLNDENEGAS